MYLFNHSGEFGIVILHDNLSHFGGRDIVLIRVFTRVDSIGVQIVCITEKEFAF